MRVEQREERVREERVEQRGEVREEREEREERVRGERRGESKSCCFLECVCHPCAGGNANPSLAFPGTRIGAVLRRVRIRAVLGPAAGPRFSVSL